MKEFAEVTGIVVLLASVVIFVALIATLPFALIGWAVTTIVGLFIIVTVSYFDMVAVGIGVAIIAKLIAQAKTS